MRKGQRKESFRSHVCNVLLIHACVSYLTDLVQLYGPDVFEGAVHRTPPKYARTLVATLFSTEELQMSILYKSAK